MHNQQRLTTVDFIEVVYVQHQVNYDRKTGKPQTNTFSIRRSSGEVINVTSTYAAPLIPGTQQCVKVGTSPSGYRVYNNVVKGINE